MIKCVSAFTPVTRFHGTDIRTKFVDCFDCGFAAATGNIEKSKKPDILDIIPDVLIS